MRTKAAFVTCRHCSEESLLSDTEVIDVGTNEREEDTVDFKCSHCKKVSKNSVIWTR